MLDLMLWDCLPFLVQCYWQFYYILEWRMFLTYLSTQNVLQVVNWIQVGISAGQGMAVIAFHCRKSIMAHIWWDLALLSINTGLVVKTWLSKWGTTMVFRMSVWYLDPLWLPWTVTDPTCNHAKCILTPSQNHRQMEWFPGCCWQHSRHLVASTHEFFHQNVAFIRSMNLSPQCKIPSAGYLTPCQTCYFVCWCQKGTFDRAPGSVLSSLQPFLHCAHWNGPVGNPVISQDHTAKKGATSNKL